MTTPPQEKSFSSEDSDSVVSIASPDAEIQTPVINELIVKTINTQAFIGAFAPMIATAITPLIQLTVHSCFQPILTFLKGQQHCIIEQKAEIKSLTETNSELTRVKDLEFGLNGPEQYGRRISLRFHNVPVDLTENGDTDSTVVKICPDMGIIITSDNIKRSHPIGRKTRNNHVHIICRFRNWKIKNKIYHSKKG